MDQRQVVDVIVRPEYVVGYEQWDDVTLGHCRVTSWTPKVARQFRADMDTAMALLGREVYALENPEYPNQVKFLLTNGFQPCGHVLNAAGREVAIFVRTLHGQSFRRWF